MGQKKNNQFTNKNNKTKYFYLQINVGIYVEL